MDILNRVRIAQRDAGEAAVMAHLEEQGLGRKFPSQKSVVNSVDETELRKTFEKKAHDSHGFKRSRRGTYQNPSVARDWKWFLAGATFIMAMTGCSLNPPLAHIRLQDQVRIEWADTKVCQNGMQVQSARECGL